MARRNTRKAEKQAPSAAAAVQQTPWLEWAASAVGLLITLAVVVLLIWDLVQATGTAAAVRVETGPIIEHPGGFTVQIVARNESRAAAAQVEVEGVLKEGGRAVETARTVFDYIPGHSERRGGLFFTREPRGFDIAVRALGYAEP